MNIKNATRLLGLITILTIASVTLPVYATTATVSSAEVTAPNQVLIVFSDPLDWTIGDFTGLNINGGPRNIVTISETAPSDTVTITFDGPTVGTASTGDIDIAAIVDGGSGNDFAGVTDQALADGQSPPAPILAQVGSSPTNDNPVLFTVDFGEDINGATFTVGDIISSSGTIQNIADSGDGQNFTFEVLDPTDGLTLSVQITGDVDDLAGNTGSLDSNTILVDVDYTSPTVVISTTAGNPTGTSPIPMTVQFSETVTGFVDTDIIIGNGAVTNFVAVDGDTYTFDLVPSADGLVTVDVGAGVANDNAGNPNTAATQFTITFDTVLPSVVLSTTSGNPTATSPIPMTAQFSETVTGFVDTDIVVGNGAVSNFVAVDGDTYTFDVTPSANGLVTVDVGAGVAVDGSANGNTAATQFTITFDDSMPSVVLTGSALETRGQAIHVTAEFSEDVTGFVDTGISVQNAALGNFAAVDGNTYTFDLLPTIEGTITAQVNAGVAQDSALNGNAASNTLSITFFVPRSDSCAGDCYHPHFGVDQNGKGFYDDGLMIDNLQYKIDNVLHNPYSALYLDVGQPVTFTMKAMDNSASQIRHMELALSIPKGDFDKQKAQVIIDLNLGWDGSNSIAYEGDQTLVKNVGYTVTKSDKTVTWALTLTPTQKLDHDMFAISVVDEYQYVGTYYVNEGIKITGISQNGVPEFDYLDMMGYKHHLTIVDQTLEDLSVAIDEQGHQWTLDGKTQTWMKEFIRPDMKCSVSSSGYSRNCVLEFNEAKLVEQDKAAEKFDSTKLQKTLPDSKTIVPQDYGRLHDPVPNMMKAYVEYAKWKAAHS